MTLGFLYYVTCSNQPGNQSLVEYKRAQCGLTQVPKDIPPTAKKVYLHLNKIKTINKGAFSYLTHCTFLNLQNNELTHLRRGMFDGLQALEQLVLSSNSIETIEKGSFLHLTSCTWLSLNENKLTHIQSDMFKGLQSLNKLMLSQNNVSKIEPGTFTDLTQLKALLLSKNYLVTLDRSVFRSPHQTSLYLKINDNPLLCDCRVCWIKQGEQDEWLSVHDTLTNGTEVDKPECVNYPGIDWHNISLTCSEVGKRYMMCNIKLSTSTTIPSLKLNIHNNP